MMEVKQIYSVRLKKPTESSKTAEKPKQILKSKEKL
ncbi:hypothetical protein ES705_32078 [subsurface metagenome]